MDTANSLVIVFVAAIMIVLIMLLFYYVFKRRVENRETSIRKILSKVEHLLDETVATTYNCNGHPRHKSCDRNFKTAKRLLDKVLHLNSACTMAHHYHALYYLKTGDDKRAEKIWKDTVAVDSEDPVPLTRLGDLYFERKAYEKAQLHYRMAIHVDNAFDPPRVGMGDIQYARGKIYSAMGFYSMANKLNDRNHRALIGLGNCYRRLGKTEKAIGCYEQAYALDATEKELSAHLSDIYSERKDYHRASDVLIRALRLYPYSPGLHKKLGDMKSLLNREKEAIDAYINFLRFKCDREKLTQFIRNGYEKYLALGIITDLVNKQKKINYAMVVKELKTIMTAYLINQRLLGKLNNAKKKAYQNFSSYFVTDVLNSMLK